MKSVRNKINDYKGTILGTVAGIGLGLSTILGSPDVADANDTDFYGGIGMHNIETQANLDIYDDINQLGNNIIENWEDIDIDDGSRFSPSVHIGKDIFSEHGTNIGLEIAFSNKSINRSNKKETYQDINPDYSEKPLEVIHDGKLDTSRTNLKLKLEQGLGPVSVYCKIGGQLYQFEFDSDTEYNFRDRVSVNDIIEADGSGLGYVGKAGGQIMFTDEIGIYAEAFKSGGNGYVDGNRELKDDYGRLSREEIESDLDLDSYGVGGGVSIKF